MNGRGASRAIGGDGERRERRVEAARGYGERRGRGGSRAKNEDDGWEKKTRRYILGRSLVPGEATAWD